MLEKLIALFRRNKLQPRQRINEPMMQIIYNPFDEKWMWTRLNPNSHVWEWMHEATSEEVKLWQGIIRIEVYENRKVDNG